MRTVERSKEYNVRADVVFDALDDLSVTGMHMTQSSMAMMGGKMHLEFLSKHIRGLYTRYRWTGKALWMNLDFTVEVTKWVDGKEKIWKTVGPANLIIYRWFQMRLKVSPTAGDSSIATLSITYKKPRGMLLQLVCFLLGDWYAKWCLNKMLNDTDAVIKKAVVV